MPTLLLPQTDQPLHAELYATIARSIKSDGVYPQHLLWRHGSMIHHETMMVPGGLVVQRAIELVVDNYGVEELCFGVDSDGDDSLEYDSAIVLAYWKDSKWRIGTINYRYSPTVCEPIDWNNYNAISWMQRMITLYAGKHKTKRMTSQHGVFAENSGWPVRKRREDKKNEC